VPDGADETANVEVISRRWGAPPGMNAPKEHFDLGEAARADGFRARDESVRRALRLSQGALARLERALGNFMLDLHTEQFGYTEDRPAASGARQAMFGTGPVAEIRGRSVPHHDGITG
jgi:seryl-tRNA synthetase